MNIVLGVTGSIAAYKALEILRLLKTQHFNVKVIMTKSAQEFVGALSFEALSGAKVNTDFWSETDTIGHIALADFADVILVAPATADFIAKLNHGFADNSLLGTCLATKSKIILAPAMNCNMYDNINTQKNISELKSKGVLFIEPEEGELACGWIGNGRLAEPSKIVEFVKRELSKKDLINKRILITAGGTIEKIDPVRCITNFSTGKMGVALAQQSWLRGATVDLVSANMSVALPKAVNNHKVTSANEMLKKVEELRNIHNYDAIIFAAAVSDFYVKNSSESKIKKDNLMLIELDLNPDIAKTISESKKNEKLIGFTLETGTKEDLLITAKNKLTNKNLDLIVANLAQDSLGKDTNHVWLVSKSDIKEFDTAKKDQIANLILDNL